MEKLFVCLIALLLLLVLILTSCLQYRLRVPAVSASIPYPILELADPSVIRENAGPDGILFMMRMSRFYLLIGAADILLFSFFIIVSLLWEENYLTAFIVFYCFVLLGVYFCLTDLLWRGVIREDSLTLYTPLFPVKKINFYEIDFVHCTDNPTFGQSEQKTLAAYRHGKKLFSIEESVIGFPFLYALLCERGIVDYVPRMESKKMEKTMSHVPVVESFSVTEKTEDIVRAVISALLLIPCGAYILWDQATFTFIYQIIAVIMLLFSTLDFLNALLWKVTVDSHRISVRNSLSLTQTYEIREITEIVELPHYIVLYMGSKKVAKIAKDSKNFQYLFERLLQTDIPISRKTSSYSPSGSGNTSSTDGAGTSGGISASSGASTPGSCSTGSSGSGSASVPGR